MHENEAAYKLLLSLHSGVLVVPLFRLGNSDHILP